MPCFYPVNGYRARKINPKTGRYAVLFAKKETYYDLLITLPCGQCIGCRLERSRQWAIRCLHEAQMHADNCFITLTYSDEFLPKDNSVNLRDFQLFMKRYRKLVAPIKFRFFHCGEYGDLRKRPHYHACIFGHDFTDKILFKETNGVKLYTSNTLELLWPLGFSTIGDVTFDSAAYVARYIMKKITGDRASDHYGNRKPEYVTMSRRPGIGSSWFAKYGTDVFPHDQVIVNSIPMRPPKFYDAIYDAHDPKGLQKIKNTRKKLAKKQASNNTARRHKDRESVLKSKLKQLPRSVE